MRTLSVVALVIAATSLDAHAVPGFCSAVGFGTVAGGAYQCRFGVSLFHCDCMLDPLANATVPGPAPTVCRFRYVGNCPRR
jgi:hypothetical protein